MCLRIERNKESFGSVGVFPPTEPMHLISTLSYEQETLQAKYKRKIVDSPISTSKGSEPAKLKSKLRTKMGLMEKGGITIRGVITRIFVFRTNRGTQSMNFTRRSPVRRTYNTEPSPKELAWGRSTPMYLGKYSFPLF